MAPIEVDLKHLQIPDMVSGIGLGMNMVAQWMKQVLYGMKDERNYYTLQKKSVI